jgi:hypothetical protein
MPVISFHLVAVGDIIRAFLTEIGPDEPDDPYTIVELSATVVSFEPGPF